MKRKISGFLVAVTSFCMLSAGTVHANDDACGMVLCLGGRVMGDSGGAACKSYEKNYFSIIKKKKGKFSASRTAKARASALNKCPGADPKVISSIGAKFGRMRGGFL